MPCDDSHTPSITNPRRCSMRTGRPRLIDSSPANGRNSTDHHWEGRSPFRLSAYTASATADSAAGSPHGGPITVDKLLPANIATTVRDQKVVTFWSGGCLRLTTASKLFVRNGGRTYPVRG